MNDFTNSTACLQSGSSNRQPSNPRYQQARELAGKAIKHAETHRTPPVPKAYEVWYSYSAGGNDLVKRRIDDTIERLGGLDFYEIDQIHEEFFSSSEKQREHHDATSFKLDREMDEIIALVQSYQASSDNYSGSLHQTAEALSDAAKPTQVRKTLEFLIAENLKMKDETAALSGNLEQSKAQVQEMRAELARSRQNEMRDPLTELGNRRCFTAAISKEVAIANERGSPLCLVLADIDQFKRVNDTFGHVIGDKVIKFFASVLAKNTRDTDICARYGGEEFAVILPSTGSADARVSIERIRSCMEKTNLVITNSQRPIGSVTASFGIAQYRENDTPQTLLQRADVKLYEAKDSGRNCIACDDDFAE